MYGIAAHDLDCFASWLIHRNSFILLIAQLEYLKARLMRRPSPNTVLMQFFHQQITCELSTSRVSPQFRKMNGWRFVLRKVVSYPQQQLAVHEYNKKK